MCSYLNVCFLIFPSTCWNFPLGTKLSELKEKKRWKHAFEMNVILQAALPCARIPVGPFLPAGIPFFLFSVPILLRSSWVGCQQPAKANHHKLLLFGSRGWRLYHSLVYKGRETTGLSQVRWILILPLPPRRAVIPSSEHFVLLTSITSHDKCFYQEEVGIFPDPPQRQIKSLSHRHSDWKKKKKKIAFMSIPRFLFHFVWKV